MNLKEISSNKIFDGYQKVFSHDSRELKCSMNFSIYLPAACESQKLPVIYWLSGLTCNELNFVQKAGAQKYAKENNVVIVCPDTSPRNLNIPGDNDSWDFGVGAGFYVNATKDPWKKSYRMFEYVTSELIEIVTKTFPVVDRQSIMGHSMGGHGALICGLKKPYLYKFISAFAPICNPKKCPWGIKAFEGYFGSFEANNWDDWDATELVKKFDVKQNPIEILIDQGSTDQFLIQGQLLPENFLEASKNSQVPVKYNLREGYDHSYFYIATFIEEHIKEHAKRLHSK